MDVDVGLSAAADFLSDESFAFEGLSSITTAYSGSPNSSCVSLQSTLVDSTEALCYDKTGICDMYLEDDAIVVDDNEDRMVICSPRPDVTSDVHMVNGFQPPRRTTLKVSELIKGAFKPIPRFSLQQLASRVKSYTAGGARFRRTKIKAYDNTPFGC